MGSLVGMTFIGYTRRHLVLRQNGIFYENTYSYGRTKGLFIDKEAFITYT